MSGSSEGSVDSLCDLCEGLHGALAAADLLGRRCKRRSAILRTLFRLIDLNSARLDLCIAQLCLAVSLLCPPGLYTITRALWEKCENTECFCCCTSPQLCVSGNNLLNICKLVFQMSRSERNDSLFQENPVIGEYYYGFYVL